MPGPWGCKTPTVKTKVSQVAIPMVAEPDAVETKSNVSVDAIVKAAVQKLTPSAQSKSHESVDVSLAKSTFKGAPIDSSVEKELRSKERPVPAGKPVATVFFDFNSSVLNGKASTELLIAFNAIKGKQIEVHGFTDSTGSYEYNQWLAQRRADRVMEYLSKASGTSEAFGHGLCCYTGSNETLDGRASNRRVDVYVIEKNVGK